MKIYMQNEQRYPADSFVRGIGQEIKIPARQAGIHLIAVN